MGYFFISVDNLLIVVGNFWQTCQQVEKYICFYANFSQYVALTQMLNYDILILWVNKYLKYSLELYITKKIVVSSSKSFTVLSNQAADAWTKQNKNKI